MIQQLLLAFFLACVTVLLHGAGTIYMAIPATGILTTGSDFERLRRPGWVLIQLVSMLLLLHLVEMCVWAAAYYKGNILPNFETALYYSLTSYTTVGYGDVIPPTDWRLIGPFEAAVGILMLGWSTSIIVAAVQRIYNARRPTSS